MQMKATNNMTKYDWIFTGQSVNNVSLL